MLYVSMLVWLLHVSMCGFIPYDTLLCAQINTRYPPTQLSPCILEKLPSMKSLGARLGQGFEELVWPVQSNDLLQYTGFIGGSFWFAAPPPRNLALVLVGSVL